MTVGKHVLIVDDYADARDMMAIHFRSLGYCVSTAGDGADAIRQAERLLPDLIVLDLEYCMPPTLPANPSHLAVEHLPDNG